MQTQTLLIDPLLYTFELHLRALYYPLGFPVEVRTNSEEILAAASESWGYFREIFSQPPLQIRVGVLEGGLAECPPEPVHRQQWNLRTSVADAENFATSDLTHGRACAWVTRATVRNRAYLRWHYIEKMSWDLLSAYLTPVHAACVQHKNRGFLLCGDSAAGKSSLAFACAKRGWTYMADDSSNLVRGRKEPIVVGNPFQIRFRESAIGLFPELKDYPLTLRATGEMAIEIPTAKLPCIRTITECFIHNIIFLNRDHSAAPRLLPFPKDKALRWFDQVICSGEPDVMDAHSQALQNLLSASVFELRYSDLAQAVAYLESMAGSNG